MRSRVLAASFLLAGIGQAHSLRERVGTYGDNEGLSRDRAAVEGNFAFTQADRFLSGSSFICSASRDIYSNSRIIENEYEREAYESGHRISDTLSVTTAQTWAKLTETRQLASLMKDSSIESHTFGVGLSQWVAKESVQMAVDISRTFTKRPIFQYLDVDTDIVSTPPDINATGTMASVRHLATPTTITQHSLTIVDSSDRPRALTYAVGVKQFLPPVNAAVHTTVARAFNRGRVATDSTYGEVDAWQWQLDYLQNLWQGGSGKIGYRFYREDQTTRAYGDELTFGSDTYSINLAQEIPKHAIDNLDFPLTLEAGYARYLTNIGMTAHSFELGMSAKF